MAVYAEDVVKKAKSYIGLKESDGSHKKIIDIYNNNKPLARGYKMKYTDAWCACFVSVVAIECEALHIIPKEVGCGKMIDLFVKLGEWVENDAHTPKAGDVIFYDWEDSGKGDNKGGANHVGIVEKVANGTITVIEGNINNAVGRRTLKVNGKYIRGYGVPKYDVKTVNKPVNKSIDTIAKEVINGKWGNGTERKQRLTAAGYNYTEVQAAVNRILYGKKTKSVDEVAKEVIAGKWGNGAERKQRLTAAGYDYNAVQKKVNQLLK